MGWYERTVFNRLMERALDQPAVHEQRKMVLALARSDVLDVGIGTGLNFPAYPDSVKQVTAVVPDGHLDGRAIDRAAMRGIRIDPVEADARRLPLPEARFDTVVCTFLLCSIREPQRALAEFRRVLRPGGRLLFLEHVAAPGRGVRAAQRLFDPLSRVMNCGCTVLADAAEWVCASGLSVETVEAPHLPALPPLYRDLVRGVARR